MILWYLQVLKASSIDENKMTIQPLCNETSVFTSQVNLFMSLGLLSLFLTFILIPILTMLIHRSLCRRVSKTNIDIANFSMLVTASLVAGSFIVYLIFLFVIYYLCQDTVDHVLFQNSFFSPMTQCMIFYSLSVVTSFLGGMAFSKCMTNKATVTRCGCLSSGLISACTTAGIFHSFFLFLALWEDPVTILSYLITFSNRHIPSVFSYQCYRTSVQEISVQL